MPWALGKSRHQRKQQSQWIESLWGVQSCRQGGQGDVQHRDDGGDEGEVGGERGVNEEVVVPVGGRDEQDGACGRDGGGGGGEVDEVGVADGVCVEAGEHIHE